MWLLAVTVPVYWVLPATRPDLRLVLICAVSFFLLWVLSPLILLTVLLYTAFLSLFAMLARAGVAHRNLKRCSWLVFLPLVLFDQVPTDWMLGSLFGPVWAGQPLIVGFALLGVSYTAIRCFIMIRESLEPDGPTILEAITAFLFFGTFVAGPITGARPYRHIAPTLTGEAGLLALSRIGWGAALFLVVKPWVADVDLPATFAVARNSEAAAWLQMYREFLVLYIDFTGYTDIAIGCGLLFGVKLPENFNWPLRATSIQEFWRRWHMSLGAFIGTYLFKPLVRETGKPTLAIFLAFAAVGLWHAVSINYFIWGVGHGAALAGYMIMRKSFRFDELRGPATYALKSAGWAFTMTYVAFLSSVANSSSYAEILALISSLF